tara:strand:- start:38 stop:232 length:195 start_codon:yes stop_codon:yes gene_type:complete
MKVYKLKIVFNPDTEEVEYIEETVNSDGPDGAEDLFHYDDIEISDYFDEDDLKMIGGCYNIGIT